MKIKIRKSGNPFENLIPKEISVESEAETKKLLIVEDLLDLMKREGVSRSELARRMGVVPSRITSILNGTNNFTIETLIRAARAVNGELHQTLAHKDKKVDWMISERFVARSVSSGPVRKKNSESAKFTLSAVAQNDEPSAA